MFTHLCYLNNLPTAILVSFLNVLEILFFEYSLADFTVWKKIVERVYPKMHENNYNEEVNYIEVKITEDCGVLQGRSPHLNLQFSQDIHFLLVLFLYLEVFKR